MVVTNDGKAVVGAVPKLRVGVARAGTLVDGGCRESLPVVADQNEDVVEIPVRGRVPAQLELPIADRLREVAYALWSESSYRERRE